MATVMPEAHADADGDPADARGALPRHAGHGVHGRGGPALHAADAQREAPGAGRGALRRRRGRRGAAVRARGAGDDRRGVAGRAAAPDVRPGRAVHGDRAGVAASPGAAKGQIVFTPDDAVDWAQLGRKVVLVRPFTEADDVHGFFAAQGILTAEGGKASHAALVARGMGKPCVAGASALRIDLEARTLRVGEVGAARGRPDRHRRLDGAGDGRRRAAHRGRGRPEPRHGARLGRPGAPAGRAGERRHAGGRAARARVRRRGHRPVPDGAHVHGRGPPAQDAGDDHGRGHRAPARGPRRAAAAAGPRTSRACSRRWPTCR